MNFGRYGAAPGRRPHAAGGQVSVRSSTPSPLNFTPNRPYTHHSMAQSQL